MLIVAALGGNALLKRGEPMTAEIQRANVSQAATALAGLIRAGHRIVVTHGNGPQVGLMALQSVAGPKESAYPLDILGAETDGMIGYLIEQELNNCLGASALTATLLTQILVDPVDPAFKAPTKPIGPVYDEATARRIAEERGWQIGRDGTGWRRVVASPQPLQILDLRVILFLVEHGVTVICAGGGGIPVVQRPAGDIVGIEAVIDKDRASSLLARRIGADILLLLTDVDAVYSDYGTPRARAIATAGSSVITALGFPAGSMGPKVEAAASFAVTAGKRAGIGRLVDAAAILAGEAGTLIGAGDGDIQYRFTHAPTSR